MTLQILNEQLLELHLPAFRQALQEQQSNSKYTELAFEERLALLVDHECTQRRENRIRRNIHTAAFSISASIEDLDISATRGLERHSILELGQCNWITARQNMIVLGPTGSGKSFWLAPLEPPRRVMDSRFVITACRVYCIRLPKRAKMVRGLNGCDQWRTQIC